MSIFIVTLLLVHSSTDGLRILPAPSSLVESGAAQQIGRMRSSREVCTHRTDIVFVLDISGSVSSDDWDDTKEFVQNFVGGLTVGPDAARVGVAAFDHDHYELIALTGDAAELTTNLTNLARPNDIGMTDYSDGMTRAITIFGDIEEDLDFRLMIVVGDGAPQNIASDKADCLSIRDSFMNTGASAGVPSTVFTVAVGCSEGHSCQTFLKDIATPATPENFFASANFEDLAAAAASILVTACESAESPAPAPAPVLTGVGGDPHVTNLAGNKFDIQKVGTYALLTINQGNAQQLALALHASIDEVAGACSAKYIQNASLSGHWLEELENSRLDVRVVHWIPKEEALQVLIGKEWHPVLVAKDRMHSDILSKTTSSQINVLLHGVTIRLSLGMNIRKVDKNQGYNFMNVNLKGLSTLDPRVRLGGLLTLDDFSGVAEAPTECNARRVKLLTRTSSKDMEVESENDGQLPFLSTIAAGPEDISFFRSTRNQH